MVRIDKVGVCASDYSSIAGKLPFTRYPIVPGHEASGEVLEAGEQTDWKPGDRVLIHPILGDRRDPVFARGEVHYSESAEVLGVVYDGRPEIIVPRSPDCALRDVCASDGG